jgi:hypothetical protein
MAGEVLHVVEYLSSKGEILSSNSSPNKKKEIRGLYLDF